MSLDTDRLMKDARIRLPGATDDAIRLELFSVLDEFFQDSNVWKEKIEFSVSATDDTSTTYYIEPESVASLHRLKCVENSNGFGVAAVMKVPGEVTLMTPPSQDDTYTATVVLTVNDPVARDGYPEFPQWILNRYRMTLLDGLMGRMMSQPAKPFTNLQLGTYHMRRFRSAVAFASTESLRKHVANTQAWRFPRNFA
jgi:hypothetical protein